MESSKRVPTNTAKEAERSGIPFLALASALGSSGAIESQEAAGQLELVNSEVLPTDMRAGAQAALEKIGFKFLGPVEGDPLFQHVEMPEGWSKRKTDHSMWSELVDSKGRKRGGIFYKAAFYDRKATLHLDCRYNVEQNYDIEDSYVQQIMDGKTVIHVMPAITLDPSSGRARWEYSDQSVKAAHDWVAHHYPDYKDPSAYWD